MSATAAAILVAPYAFVVAKRPERRFWGETAPLGRVVLSVAAICAALGVATGLTAPRPTMTFRVLPGPSTGPHSMVLHSTVTQPR